MISRYSKNKKALEKENIKIFIKIGADTLVKTRNLRLLIIYRLKLGNIKRKIVKNIFGNAVEKLRKNAFIKRTEKMIYDVTAK